MADEFVDVLNLLPRGLLYIVLSIAILAVAKLVQDLLTPFHIGDQLTGKDNVALAVSIAGYYLGVITVIIGVLSQPLSGVVGTGFEFTSDLAQDLLEVVLYSLAGIVALNLSRIFVDKVVLHKFHTETEIIQNKNLAAGAVEFAVYVAVGLLIAASLTGTGGGPDTSIVFFALGLVVLALYALLFDMVTPFSVQEQIHEGNVAVGVALGGNLIAIGVIVFKAVAGDFLGWSEAFIGFGVFAVVGIVLLFILRFVIDLILHPSAKINDELVVDQNVGVAFIEGAVVIGAGLILLFAI